MCPSWNFCINSRYPASLVWILNFRYQRRTSATGRTGCPLLYARSPHNVARKSRMTIGALERPANNLLGAGPSQRSGWRSRIDGSSHVRVLGYQVECLPAGAFDNCGSRARRRDIASELLKTSCKVRQGIVRSSCWHAVRTRGDYEYRMAAGRVSSVGVTASARAIRPTRRVC